MKNYGKNHAFGVCCRTDVKKCLKMADYDRKASTLLLVEVFSFLGIVIVSLHWEILIILIFNKKTEICEAKSCQARRGSQSIMDIYGQEPQRSMTRFWAHRSSDFH